MNLFLSKHGQREVAFNDLIQANWELLIEVSFDVFLPVFGDGADMNGTSGRVKYPSKSPTHHIVCQLIQPTECLYTGEIQNDLSGFYFEKMISDSFEIIPPFDYVYLVNLEDERRVIPLEAASFHLIEL